MVWPLENFESTNLTIAEVRLVNPVGVEAMAFYIARLGDSVPIGYDHWPPEIPDHQDLYSRRQPAENAEVPARSGIYWLFAHFRTPSRNGSFDAFDIRYKNANGEQFSFLTATRLEIEPSCLDS